MEAEVKTAKKNKTRVWEGKKREEEERSATEKNDVSSCFLRLVLSPRDPTTMRTTPATAQT